MVVDSVSDVMTLTPEQIRPAPEMNTTFNDDFLIVSCTLDERMLILVDIEKLMSSPEMGLLITQRINASNLNCPCLRPQ